VSPRNTPGGRVGRPPVTSRAQILTAARRLIDSNGWEKLTVRKLAAEIGIGPATMYHHVRDKHDALAAWPWAAEVLATDGFMARLSNESLWLVETIVAGAVEHGCTPAQAVHLFRGIWYYTIGEILVRARSGHRQAGDPVAADGFADGLDRTRLPHLATVSGQWAALSSEDTYRPALRAFVDGLLAQAGSGTAGR
jgi:AcrR family transcriptional regulator